MTVDRAEQSKPSAELLLIQVSEEAALIFGPNAPSWLDVRPLLGATSEDQRNLTEAAALALGVGNVALQLSPALMAAHGIVQLSPATMAALQTMTPIVGANGWNIGTLAAASGEFGHSVQWAPLAAASGTSFIATLGPSLVLVGIQLQLMQISRKVDANIALTKEVLAELEWANNAELSALIRNVQRAYGEALAIGGATLEVYGEIRGKEHLLDKSRTLLMIRISSYVAELDRATTREARRKWLTDHGERCLDDLQALVQVHQAWFVFQALRAAHVAESDISSRGAILVSRIREAATGENELTTALVVELADRLQRALGLLEESGNKRLGRFKSAKDARAQARALREQVLTTVADAAPVGGEPEVLLAPSDKLARATRMLPLLIDLHQPPVLAASCVLDIDPEALIDLDRNGFLFVLDDELVVLREKALFNDHRVDRRIPMSEVRYVRADGANRKIGVATTDGSFGLTWPAAASAVELTYANDLLRSLMHLPSDEIPVRPLPPAVTGLPSLTAELLRELDEDDNELRALD